MKKIIIAIILIIIALVIIKNARKGEGEPNDPSMSLPEGSYTVNTDASEIAWKANMGKIKSHHGTVTISSGNLVLGEEDTGELVLDMNSITSEVGDALNTHLKSGDFFDVAAYPEARFVLSSLDEDTLSGELTMKGITETQSTDKLHISQDEEGNYVLAGMIEVDRSLYNVRYGSSRFFNDLGDQVINDIITIDFTIVLNTQ